MRPFELAIPHIVHVVMPHGVACNVVLFILIVSLQVLLTA